MIEKDFEYYLTKQAWDDPKFEKALNDDPINALKSKGIVVPEGFKLRIIVQKKTPFIYLFHL